MVCLGHELPHAPTQLACITGLEVLEGAVLGSGPSLASLETHLSIGMDGDHAEGLAPAGREHLALSHPSKPVNHEQRWTLVHAVNGVRKADGEHVITVFRPKFNRDSTEDPRVALEPLAHDLLSDHVAHGANWKGEGGGHLRKFPLPASGQATDGQHTDHALPWRRGDMKGATGSVLEGLLSPPHIDERPKNRGADQKTA